ncbi:MAG: hypothetical protein HY257_01300 [Chloroflexi bacterium]|nr:hypothetical protein [Chloroflexota bacterium]
MAHAARGTRKLTSETETIQDAALRAQLRRQAAKVYAESILAGIALTALFIFIP